MSYPLSRLSRRTFLRSTAAATAIASGGPAFAFSAPSVALAKDSYKFVFIQYQPHTVSDAWDQGIRDVATIQPNIKALQYCPRHT